MTAPRERARQDASSAPAALAPAPPQTSAGEPVSIRVYGARQNNLKGIDVEVPLGRLVVVTGLSGAGKSSLVFETLHAEGQRRYVETFSPYTRQFLEMLDRPEVERVENIRPSIAIEQSNTVKTSRSTVGTMTELCDFFKVWFCHRAELLDPETGERVEDDNPASIWRKALERFGPTSAGGGRGGKARTALVTFEAHRPERLSWDEVVAALRGQGYTRVLVGRGKDNAAGGGALAVERFDGLDVAALPGTVLTVVQDRLELEPAQATRFLEAARTALHFGRGELQLYGGVDRRGRGGASLLGRFSEGLHAPDSGRRFRPAQPALFSFNSPVGACPRCRGFGRVIEIDYRLVIPNESLSLYRGAIRPFSGHVYSESYRDLLRGAEKHGVRTGVPYGELTEEEKAFVLDGEPGYVSGETPGGWYGVRRFFQWLESNTYKMHVRVFLSKYRAYTTCSACGGTRLQPDALNWRWRGHTLPALYQMPVAGLLDLVKRHHRPGGDRRADLAAEAVLARLGYLQQVGLGYLTLDRPSRTLSGGEVERVNLTSCLGTSLVDTLFVLDEPSVGLHAQDIDRLIGILRRLTDQGNTVVVVEHDESIMRAADHIIEVGPRPGAGGGQIVASGPLGAIAAAAGSPTGAYLSGRETIEAPADRRPVGEPPSRRKGRVGGPRAKAVAENQPAPSGGRRGRGTGDPNRWLTIRGATQHNIRGLDLNLPLGRLVCLCGVSGSGKSTLLDNVIYQGLLARAGRVAEDPAQIRSIAGEDAFAEVVLVDQAPISRTPRSNAVLFTGAWEIIRQVYSGMDEALAAGLEASAFSFNAGPGRCETCQGLGYERVEMQFMADVFVTCPGCEGRRFKPEVLAVTFDGRSVADLLEMTVSEAREFLSTLTTVRTRLGALEEVGLGYLPLGQPLNTLSGGESQRLKLVKYLARFEADVEPALLLLDEPTTGLHRDDVKRLIEVLQLLVDRGHSAVVIEHQLDVVKSADWVIEMGPGPGAEGGRVVFEGTPEGLAKTSSASGPFLRAELDGGAPATAGPGGRKKAAGRAGGRKKAVPRRRSEEPSVVAEAPPSASPAGRIRVEGAREHNLKDITVEMPHRELTVVTGVSGSGKSTLAFDIVFAEGQRRFMESMSPYARQFVEQLPRPDIDQLSGIAPAVAIEQRVTHGTRKSTVATITEVAQYLRLLYARVGVQHSPVSGDPLVGLSPGALARRFTAALEEAAGARARKRTLHLCFPLIRGRKGHHEPVARWARFHGYRQLRIDGRLIELGEFQRLSRYAEHDIDVVVADFVVGGGTVSGEVYPAAADVLEERREAARSRRKKKGSTSAPAASAPAGGDPPAGKKKEAKKRAPRRERGPDPASPTGALQAALELGPGACFLADAEGAVEAWFSTTRTDPATGDSYPELDPKHFSWNSPRGWCPTCHGYGSADAALPEDGADIPDAEAPGPEDACPSCAGGRLNPLSAAVRLHLRGGVTLSLPELLRLTPTHLLAALGKLKLDARGAAIARDLLPEIEERLKFMGEVGLDYLTLDRATATLSGGEAQRIRLAAQLGSNLSGVLYVLDEPSIGLHARDNARLLKTLRHLRDKGNTLLVVEHDEDTLRQADRIVDLGPGAGRHGGELIANGSIEEIARHPTSLTGRYLREGIRHPLRGTYRDLPPPFNPRGRGRRPKAGATKAETGPAWLVAEEVALRNLKGGDLHLPLGRLTMVCGVSGAGKSTLVRDLLGPATAFASAAVADRVEGKTCARAGRVAPGSFGRPPFRRLHNAGHFRRVVEVDQRPIGKTPRSTPATYTGAFDIIRSFFGQLPEAQVQGLSASTFSFNTKGGRCETCKGAGRIKLEMNFMPDTYMDCDDCGGRRYGPELEEVRWKGKNIADVLAMTFEEAASFFDFHHGLRTVLGLMVETGLGYLTLGQTSPTLSGGEAQRLKLVTELAKGAPSYKDVAGAGAARDGETAKKKARARPRQTNLYLLEEPTIGLHLADCERLIELLHRLVDQGHTVVVIEHHIDLLAEADYLVEIGPEGGERGGHILYQGPVEGILQRKRSPTAPFLRAALQRPAPA